jgi:hypothetical protein
MQERVELAGGSLEITSAPTRGTEIHVCFPLSLASHDNGQVSTPPSPATRRDVEPTADTTRKHV